jgi:hypothetical protein
MPYFSQARIAGDVGRRNCGRSRRGGDDVGSRTGCRRRVL